MARPIMAFSEFAPPDKPLVPGDHGVPGAHGV